MRVYQEITLLPNADIDRHFLWSKTFQQLHLGLVELLDGQNQAPVGVAFPDYRLGEKYGLLGARCRLFAADEATLQRFDAPKWLARLGDYVHCTGVRAVPDKVSGHATYRRLQPKGSKERLARRYAKRHGLAFETALQATVTLEAQADAAYITQFRYCELEPELPNLPFIRMKSLGSGEGFCLWIKKTPAEQATSGTFSSYGLSATTTLPEF